MARVISALQAYEADGGDLSILYSSDSLGGNAWISTQAENYYFNSSSSNRSGFQAYIGKLSQIIRLMVFPSTRGYYTDPYSYNDVSIFIGQFCPHGSRSTSTATSSDAAVATKLSNGSDYCQDL